MRGQNHLSQIVFVLQSILVLCCFPAWPAGGESEKAAERQLQQQQLRVPVSASPGAACPALGKMGC